MNKMESIVSKVESIVAPFCLVFASLIVFLQALLRIFNYSLFWAEEVALFLIAWFVFIGASIGVETQAHVAMDGLKTILSPQKMFYVDKIINIICIVFCMITFNSGIKFVLSAVECATTSTSLELPLAYLYAALPVGMLGMFIKYTVKLFSRREVI